MFFENGVAEEGGMLSFAQLERKEVENSTKSLLEIESKLSYPLPEAVPKSEPECETHDSIRRYYSEGYDSNYEGVEDNEIRQWQQAFPYICVLGQSMPTSHEINMDHHVDLQSKIDEQKKIENTIDPSESHFIDECFPNLDHESLCIVGKAAAIHRTPTVGTKMSDQRDAEKDAETFDRIGEDDGEYLAQDGSLEEIIECSNLNEDSANVTDPEKDVNSSINPMATKREEVLSSILDTIWPDIVESAMPLVKKVLQVARDHDKPYDIDYQQPERMEYEHADGFDFASDDGW